jgi:uncharacterized SAM-binding protein YcdF (DUF218 family)
MLLFISKVLPPFLFPAGLTILLCLLAARLAFRKGSRAAGRVSLCAALLMYSASSPLVSDALLRGLERQNLPPADYSKASAIVLMGGGMSPFTPPRVFPETNGAGDRLLHAARLWKRGLAPKLVTTGGYIAFLTDAPGTEAGLYADLLNELFDVPPEALIRMGRSRTTSEDAVLTAELFADSGWAKDILLVTSASHMPRAAALFRKQGFDVHPAPTDFHADEGAFKFMDLLPSGMALAESGIALHEYLGLWAYRMLGRL